MADWDKGVRIESEGTHRVTLKGVHWEKMPEKNGDANRMCLVLPGWTDEMRYAEHRLFFTRNITQGGANKGKPLYVVNSEMAIRLGMSSPFSPTKISELDGAVCEFVMELEEWEGKKRLHVKFINPAKEELDKTEAERIWKEMMEGGGVKGPGPVEAGKKIETGKDPDDIPFG